MTIPHPWPRVLVIVGLAAMLIGAVDPLEGSFVILPGVGLATIGALAEKSRWKKLLAWSFVLVAVGVAAMVVLSSLGGIGGDSGQSVWWGVFILPYPIGWVTGLAGGVLALIESWKRRAPRTEAAE